MDRHAELALFENLARGRAFKDWIQGRLTKEYEVLTKHGDIEMVRRAQGRAQLLLEMNALMDQATP